MNIETQIRSSEFINIFIYNYYFESPYFFTPLSVSFIITLLYIVVSKIFESRVLSIHFVPNIRKNY